MVMSDYTQIEDYDCPECAWSLHVEKRVWSETDNHPLVINYIQSEVKRHSNTHRPKMYEGLTADIGDSAYLYVSKDMDK